MNYWGLYWDHLKLSGELNSDLFTMFSVLLDRY
jgi:hypothetical protein